jgi:hypothetical protein
MKFMDTLLHIFSGFASMRLQKKEKCTTNIGAMITGNLRRDMVFSF